MTKPLTATPATPDEGVAGTRAARGPAPESWPWPEGKVGLITGATGGMGKVVAAELARRGATVVLVARDRTRGESVRGEIVAETGNTRVGLLLADLTEFADVRRLAAEFRARYPALHVLVDNAGAFATEHSLNREGVERNLAINYFSPFLLTGLLLGPLQAGAPSRIVNVGSAAMAKRLDLDGLGAGTRPIGTRGYATAKLALLMSGYALARRLDGTGVTVNALHPGVTATGIGGDAVPRPFQPLLALAKAAAVRLSLVATPEEGARTTILLTTAPELAAVTGTYFVDGREHPSPPESYDVDLQERLWECSARLVGLDLDGVDATQSVEMQAVMRRGVPAAAPTARVPDGGESSPNLTPTLATH
jgi:NAD(P)-dependent dehydrogenase (short-subunit alcohol dehydrogenase family)